jgi:hypothetical protein
MKFMPISGREKQKSPTDPHGPLGLPSQCRTNIIGGLAKTAPATKLHGRSQDRS